MTESGTPLYNEKKNVDSKIQFYLNTSQTHTLKKKKKSSIIYILLYDHGGNGLFSQDRACVKKHQTIPHYFGYMNKTTTATTTAGL